MEISSLFIVAGIILLALGLVRKVKKLIRLGIIVAIIAVIVTGGLGIFSLAILI